MNETTPRTTRREHLATLRNYAIGLTGGLIKGSPTVGLAAFLVDINNHPRPVTADTVHKDLQRRGDEIIKFRNQLITEPGAQVRQNGIITIPARNIQIIERRMYSLSHATESDYQKIIEISQTQSYVQDFRIEKSIAFTYNPKNDNQISDITRRICAYNASDTDPSQTRLEETQETDGLELNIDKNGKPSGVFFTSISDEKSSGRQFFYTDNSDSPITSAMLRSFKRKLAKTMQEMLGQ